MPHAVTLKLVPLLGELMKDEDSCLGRAVFTEENGRLYLEMDAIALHCAERTGFLLCSLWEEENVREDLYALWTWAAQELEKHDPGGALRIAEEVGRKEEDETLIDWIDAFVDVAPPEDPLGGSHLPAIHIIFTSHPGVAFLLTAYAAARLKQGRIRIRAHQGLPGVLVAYCALAVNEYPMDPVVTFDKCVLPQLKASA